MAPHLPLLYPLSKQSRNQMLTLFHLEFRPENIMSRANHHIICKPSLKPLAGKKRRYLDSKEVFPDFTVP